MAAGGAQGIQPKLTNTPVSGRPTAEQYRNGQVDDITIAPDQPGLMPASTSFDRAVTPMPGITQAQGVPASGGKGGGLTSQIEPGGGIPDPQIPPGGGIPDPQIPPIPPGGMPDPQVQAGPRAPNINQTAATGINDSIAGARREMDFVPNAVQAGGYNARQSFGQGYNATGAAANGFNAADVGSQGFNATGVNSQGYNNATTGSQGYGAQNAAAGGYGGANTAGSTYTAERTGSSPGVSAQNVSAGQLSNTNLSPYMNQYQSEVIDNTLGDMDRARQLQMQDTGARASASGAFGGSRHALAEAENNRNFFDQAGQTAASLRQSGFNQAQGMAQQDIASAMQANLANQGANLQAGSLTANLAQQSALANQNAGNQAGQFGAQSQLQANLANQASQNRAAEFGAGAQNQANLANAASGNRASEFGSSASNQAALANLAATNQSRQFGATAANQANQQTSAQQQAANQFGASAANQASAQQSLQQQQANQFGAQAGNTANLSNQAAQNAANQFGAQAGNTAALTNQAASNRASEFNVNQNQAAQMANQNAQLAGSQQRLGAANQLGNLANLGFGMGQTASGNLAQDGAMKQGLNQLLIDAAKNQFNQYSGAPLNTIGLLSQALGASPIPQTTTTGKQPGLFDYLTLAAGM